MTQARWAILLMIATSAARAEPDTFLTGNGQDGEVTIDTWRTVNGYAQVTGPLAPGDTSIPVSSTAGFAAGDLVLVLQTTGLVPEPATNGGDPVSTATRTRTAAPTSSRGGAAAERWRGPA